jgi:hypothetical protein
MRRSSPSPDACHGCAGTNPRRLCTLYSLVAFQLTRAGLTSNYSNISCRNSPHRQLKFAIGHNSSLIAILRIHPSAFDAHRPSQGPISHVSNGLYIQHKYFYFVMQACLPRQDRHHQGFWGNQTRCLSQKKQDGVDAEGIPRCIPGCWAAGPGLWALMWRASAAKRAGAGFR